MVGESTLIWPRHKLGELEAMQIIELGRGEVISKKDIQSAPGPYPIYSSSAQNNGLFGTYANHMFEEELVTWSIDGGGYFFYRPKHRFSVTNVCGFLRVLSPQVCTHFVAYALSWVRNSISFDYQHKAHPSVIRELISIPIPPLPEQRKIAAILSSVDDAIEKSSAVIDQLEVVKKALMQELLSRGLPGRHTSIEEQSTHLPFKDRYNPLNAPQWQTCTLESVCEGSGQYGANISKASFDPRLPRYIRITDIASDGRLITTDPVSINDKHAEGYLLKPGDILLARSGATVGKSYLHVAENGKCAFAGYLIRFRTRPEFILPEYLIQFFQSRNYWSWVKNTQRALAQPNINAKEYGRLPVPLPSLAEQRAIASILASFDRCVDISKSKLEQLRAMKLALLSVLLSGEVRVPLDKDAA